MLRFNFSKSCIEFYYISYVPSVVIQSSCDTVLSFHCLLPSTLLFAKLKAGARII